MIIIEKGQTPTQHARMRRSFAVDSQDEYWLALPVQANRRQIAADCKPSAQRNVREYNWADVLVDGIPKSVICDCPRCPRANRPSPTSLLAVDTEAPWLEDSQLVWWVKIPTPFCWQMGPLSTQENWTSTALNAWLDRSKPVEVMSEYRNCSHEQHWGLFIPIAGWWTKSWPFVLTGGFVLDKALPLMVTMWLYGSELF